MSKLNERRGCSPGEQVAERELHRRVVDPVVELLKTHVLDEFLKQDLDEDAFRTRRVLRVQPDLAQHSPRDGVGEQEVGKQLGDVPQTVRVEPGSRE